MSITDPPCEYIKIEHLEQALDLYATDVPQKPENLKFLTLQEKQSVLGVFVYTVNADSTIQITTRRNFKIVNVVVPQLQLQCNLKSILLNEKCAESCVKMFQNFEDAGLLDRILTFDGSYAPRMVRGSKTMLSTHAFGSAIDLNYKWNQLNTDGALVGEDGSVRELVMIAYENNWAWGGWFSRCDPMHFEYIGQ